MNLAHITKNFYSNCNIQQMKHVTRTVLVPTYNSNEQWNKEYHFNSKNCHDVTSELY